MKSQPDFIVIGAQKAATTFVQMCLAEHPDIWMPGGETPWFEDPDYDPHDRDYFARLFAGRSEPLLGIKRPNYLGRAEVPARIAADCPEAKLIAVLRPPVARTVSAYFHYVRGGFLPVLPPEEGLTRILDDPEFRARHRRAGEVVEFSFQGRHLAAYRPFLERERLKAILHEDVAADPQAAMLDIYEFLGAAPGHRIRHPRARPQALVHNPLRLRALRRMALLTGRFDADMTRGLGYRSGLAGLAAASYNRFDRIVLGRLSRSGKPVLAAPLQARLNELFAPDIDALGELLGRDLSHWKG